MNCHFVKFTFRELSLNKVNVLIMSLLRLCSNFDKTGMNLYELLSAVKLQISVFQIKKNRKLTGDQKSVVLE